MREGYKQTEVGGFQVNWDVMKLGEATELITKGTTPTSLGKSFKEAGINFIKIESLEDNGKIIKTKIAFIDEDTNRLLRRSQLKENDILFSIAGALGRVTIVTCDILPANTNQALAIIRLKQSSNIDHKFLFYFLNSLTIKKQIESINVQAAQANLSLENINDLIITFPMFSEQAAIAEALSDADALISRLEQLIAKKRNIKQGAMQELLTGKKRLTGFGGEWEVKKLGEVADRFVNGGTPSTKNEDYWTGNIPWITGADILGQSVSAIRRHITGMAVRNSSTNVIEKGNLLLVSRTGVGKLAIAPFDVAISQDFTGIYVDKTELLTEYLYRYFDFNQSLLQSQNQGTSIQGITRDTLSAIPILLPSLPEQTAIAQILSDMDAEIEQLGQKLDKYRMINQGMMQELLTGKTRLI